MESLNRCLSPACLRCIAVVVAAGVSCFPPPLQDNSADRNGALRSDTTLVSLYLPLQKVAIAIRDETHASNPPVISEGFFIEVANALSQYEVSKRFKVMPVPIADTPSAAMANQFDSLLKTFRYRILADTVAPDRMAATIRSIAQQCSVDLVILPLKASVRETLGKQEGWRSDKYGQSYERPVTCLAEASISLQIWNRNGALLYKKTGSGSTRQPLFYSMLKKDSPKKEDLIHFSKNVFAPPLIRALSTAVKEAFPAERPAVVRGRRN